MKVTFKNRTKADKIDCRHLMEFIAIIDTYLMHWNLTIWDKHDLYKSYVRKHGLDGIKALLGFVNYARDNKLDELTIKATLCHDLNGVDDEWLLPKASAYLKYFN